MGCIARHTWSTGEIRQVVMEKKAAQDGESQVPKGMASMKLEELVNACKDAGIALPSKLTRAQLQLLLRETLAAPDQTVVCFGRHKGSTKWISGIPPSWVQCFGGELRVPHEP